MPPGSNKPHPSGTSSGSAQYTPADYSYFSPHAPFTSTSSAPNLFNPNSLPSPTSYAAPRTQTTHTTTPGGPVITSITSTRGVGGYSSGNGARGPHPAQINPSETLQQFALHIPPPPPLTLSNSAMRNPGALSATSSGSSSHSGSQRPSPASISFAQRPPPSPAPQMTLSSTAVKHTLTVLLPKNIQPEMVTISANKGDRIRVVADAFGGDECHYEWQISFPPYDIDMSAIHARFDPDGRLTLDVKRRSRPMYF